MMIYRGICIVLLCIYMSPQVGLKSDVRKGWIETNSQERPKT